MLQTFTVSTFSPYVGDTFRVVYDPSSVLELTLASAEELGTESAREWREASGRAPFTLTFVGPTQHYLQQGTYRFEHDKMDPFEVFMVPLGLGKDGMQYEVVFT